MTLFPRRRTGRAVLTVVLLLSTQFAFAGQVCRSVMGGGMPNGRPAQVLFQGAQGTAVAMDMHACCDHAAMPASPCLTALDGMSVAALASAGASVSDLVPPIGDRMMGVLSGAPSTSIPLPTTSVGPPLPSYIVFRRFLS